MNSDDPKHDKLLRLDAVLTRIPIGKSTWWELIRKGKAPKPLKISRRITAWRESDLNAWIDRGIDKEGV